MPCAVERSTRHASTVAPGRLAPAAAPPRRPARAAACSRRRAGRRRPSASPRRRRPGRARPRHRGRSRACACRRARRVRRRCPVRSPAATGPASSTPRRSSSRDQPARRVIGAARDEARLAAEPADPRRDVRRLAAGHERDRRRDVVVARGRRLEPHDDVEQQISQRDHAHAAILAHSPRGAPAAAGGAPWS